MIFHSKVVNYQHKGNVAGGMAEKAGGGGFMEPKDERRLTTLVLLSLPASFSPYIVLSIRNNIYFLPSASNCTKGRRDKRDKTWGEKRLTWVLIYWGMVRGVPK